MEGKIVRRKGGSERKEMSREEVRKMIRKLKDRKAITMDKVPKEVWKYGRRWGRGYGEYVMKCGKVEDGRRNGKRE